MLFTSPSTVKSFVDQQAALTREETARLPAYGSIGPITTETLEELGLPVAFEAPEPRLDHFVAETISYLKARNRPKNPTVSQKGPSADAHPPQAGAKNSSARC